MNSKNNAVRIGLWVLLLFITAGLLIGIATSRQRINDLRRQLDAKQIDAEKFRDADEALESLRASAAAIAQQRSDEKELIKSVLRSVRNIDDLEIDSDHLVWTLKESWMGDDTGHFSLFFHVPNGTHRFVATATRQEAMMNNRRRPLTMPFSQFGVVPLIVRTERIEMAPEAVRMVHELVPNRVYEFRFERTKNGDSDFKFELRLLDQSGALLATKELVIHESYKSGYGRSGTDPPYRYPNEMEVFDLQRLALGMKVEDGPDAKMMQLNLPFASVKEEKLRIECFIQSDGPKVVDGLKLLRFGLVQPQVAKALTPNPKNPNMLIVGEIQPK